MPSATRTIEHEVRIDASPETVFGFFTDPAKMVRWMGTSATLDPRPGGVCRVAMSREIGETAMSGEFVEVNPYSRVVFTCGWERDLFGVPPASTRVEVDLVPDGAGTVVRLVHRALPEEAADVHKAGWEHYMERLAVAAEAGDPGPDEWLAPGLSPSSVPEDAA